MQLLFNNSRYLKMITLTLYIYTQLYINHVQINYNMQKYLIDKISYKYIIYNLIK